MCGITGIYAFNEVGRFFSIKLQNAIESLSKRGPDFLNSSLQHKVNLGHTRLSIIDLSPEAHQPMQDEQERYTIAFNGEIYNFKTLRERLIQKGATFRNQSDTEVVLKAYMYEGIDFLKDLNGFFAFAIYDAQEDEFLLVRDRMGIKPLLVYQDEDKLLFASEMKALINFGIPKVLDYESLHQYLQFNYIPPEASIFKNVRKLKAGHYLKINKHKELTEQSYHTLPETNTSNSFRLDYDQSQAKIYELLEESVKKRLVADVPLGTFLSGGIDSSVITALASKHVKNLNTFSIGYRDEAFFDETKYANLVAKKLKTNHTVFSLSNQDLYDSLFAMLDYIDEPFADSSALAVYILSQKTRQKVKVALSGDGADEMFSGYNKHSAEFKARSGGFLARSIVSLLPLWRKLPKSRNNFISNKFRQFQRFAEAQKCSPQERYWTWASLYSEKEAKSLLSEKSLQALNAQELSNRKHYLLEFIQKDSIEGFNEVLRTDLHLVLQGDMLTKVDLMSMANGLEVRVPFLDHNLVEFVNSLPYHYKIDSKIRKKILQDTFRKMLPAELYKRPKRGFEVPLLKWLRGELRPMIEDELLEDSFIEEQGIFSLRTIQSLKQKLFSRNPEDAHAHIWALLVFQYWWKKWEV